MNHPIIVVWDNFILFNTSHVALTNFGTPLSIKNYITKIGLLVPVGYKTLSAFALEGLLFSSPEKDESIYPFLHEEYSKQDSLGLIFTPKGKLVTISGITLNPFKFHTNIILHGNGIRNILSFEVDVNDSLHAVISTAESIHDAWNKINNILPVNHKECYRIFRLDELLLWINECLKYGVALPFEGMIIKPDEKSDMINFIEEVNIHEQKTFEGHNL